MEQGAKRGGWRGRLKNKKRLKRSGLFFSACGPFFNDDSSLNPVLTATKISLSTGIQPNANRTAVSVIVRGHDYLAGRLEGKGSLAVLSGTQGEQPAALLHDDAGNRLCHRWDGRYIRRTRVTVGQ